MTYLLVSNDPVSLASAVRQYAQSYNANDVFWVRRAADKKEITVDVINQMIEQTALSPVADKKLFIIFEADSLNTSAQNKLLKTIEEADDQTTFLFLCQSLTNILPTVKSRAVVRHYQTEHNATLAKLRATNPDSQQIAENAKKLFTATNVDQALTLLPIFTKPENFTLALSELNQALGNSYLPVNQKLRLYHALAEITRRANANCNAVNNFDLLLLTLFQ